MAVLEIPIFMDKIKHLNQIFLFPFMSINFLSMHILVFLNLCTYRRKLVFYTACRIA
jgi:hypothetical protein